MSSLIIRGEEKHGMATWSHSDQSTPKPQNMSQLVSNTICHKIIKDHKRSHSNHWWYLVIFLYLSASLPRASQCVAASTASGKWWPSNAPPVSCCWPLRRRMSRAFQSCDRCDRCDQPYLESLGNYIYNTYMTIRSNQYKYNINIIRWY